MDQDHGIVLDRLAFSQMILTALAHDFVTPFRTATACCRQLIEHARETPLFNASDIRQIEETRSAISKELFPKLLGLHDGAKRLQGGEPTETVAFLVDKVDGEIEERLADLRSVMALAEKKDPHRVLDALIDDLETTTRKISAMMEGIKATVSEEPVVANDGRRVAVADAVARVDEVLRPLSRDLKIGVEGDVHIEGHPWRIWSVFSNLIGNAVKYTKPGQEARVEIRVGRPPSMSALVQNFANRIQKDRVSDHHYFVFLKEAERTSEWCEINVTDYGMGIPPRKQWGIFKLFKQLKSEDGYDLHDVDLAHKKMLQAYTSLESASPTSHMGIGMGLALTQYYVRSHGGEIAVHSKVGGPTTFGIWLPLTPGSKIDPIELRGDVWWRQ